MISHILTFVGGTVVGVIVGGFVTLLGIAADIERDRFNED